MTVAIAIDRQRIAEFCRKWSLTEFCLFGSVLRDDFRPDSDVDVLVTFAQKAHIGLRELAQMGNELREIFGREVDLVERAAVEQSSNYIRRRHVLANLERVYEEG